jgi:tetratricopeptide (TPR) repeat protein
MDVRVFIMILIVGSPIVLSAQLTDGKIDSLRTALNGLSGEQRVNTLYELSYNLVDLDNKSALKYGLEGYIIAQKEGDSLQIVRAGLVTASVLRRLQKLDSSVLIYNSIFNIAEVNKYDKELGFILNGLGICYTFMAEYDKALEYYFPYLELMKSSKDTVSEIRGLINIGVVYYKLRDYEKALDFFHRCKDLQEETGHQIDSDVLMINIGLSYAYLQKYSEALRFINLGEKICGKACPRGRTMGMLFARGLVYFGLGESVVAESFFKQSFRIAKESDDIRFQLDNIDYLSQIYLDQNTPEKAAYYLEYGAQLIRAYPSFSLERVKIYSRLGQLFRSVRDYKKASDYQALYILLRDSVWSEELTNNLMRIEAQFFEKENLKQIASQKELLALNEGIINRQRKINTLFLTLISVSLVIVLCRNWMHNRRLNLLLDQKVAERTKQLHSMNDKLVSACQECDLMLKRKSKIYHELINRLESLCQICLKEVADPMARAYILKIDALTKEDVGFSKSQELT